MSCDELLVGELLVWVNYFVVNYKDVLVVNGYFGVVLNLFYVLGIDVVGEVVELLSSKIVVG